MNFQAIPDNARVCQQAGDIVLIKADNLLRVKAGVGLPVAFLLAKDGHPAQTGLLSVQAELFEQRLVVIFRAPPPDGIVVVHVQWVGAAPGGAAAGRLGGHGGLARVGL